MEQNIITGRIIKEKRGLFTCESEEKLILCRAASRFRNSGIAPVAGDEVNLSDNGDGTGFITEILPRRNYFLRPHVANVDSFLIVITSASPSPDLYVIDKLSCVALKGGAEPVFVVNKNDLSSGDWLAQIYRKCGFKVFQTVAYSGQGTDELSDYVAGKTSVLCGASGVGKSTLINALCPGVAAETGDISGRIGRGKNTTRHTELFPIRGGGYIVDSPGFSLLDISEVLNAPPEELSELFPEFENYVCDCRYRGCTHTKDEGCAVVEASLRGEIPRSRLDSYNALYGELSKHRYDRQK